LPWQKARPDTAAATGCDDARWAERRIALKSFPSGVKARAVHPPGSKDVFKFLQRAPEDLILRPQEARLNERCRFLKDRPFREVEDPDDVVVGMFPESDTGTVDVDQLTRNAGLNGCGRARRCPPKPPRT
jgi:hypothetical protein